MLIYNQQSAEIAMGRLMSLFLDPEYKDNWYGWDQETSSNREITKVNKFTNRARKAISRAQRIKIPEVIREVETKSAIKTKLVIGIKTLLDIITITL